MDLQSSVLTTAPPMRFDLEQYINNLLYSAPPPQLGVAALIQQGEKTLMASHIRTYEIKHIHVPAMEGQEGWRGHIILGLKRNSIRNCIKQQEICNEL